MLGERTSQLVSFEMKKLLAGAVVISPFIPMFFMGEEFSENNPFLYFVSHTDAELAKAVREGRKREFAAFHLQGEAPDPNDEETFNRSKLQWEVLNSPPHATMFEWYKFLIALRKKESCLNHLDRDQLVATVIEGRNLLAVKRWQNNERVICLVNFSKQPEDFIMPDEETPWHKIVDSADRQWNGPGETALTKVFNHAVTVQPESLVIYKNHTA